MSTPKKPKKSIVKQPVKTPKPKQPVKNKVKIVAPINEAQKRAEELISKANSSELKTADGEARKLAQRINKGETTDAEKFAQKLGQGTAKRLEEVLNSKRTVDQAANQHKATVKGQETSLAQHLEDGRMPQQPKM